MEQIIYNDIRVQILSDSIIRVERAKNGAFLDNNTFFIPDREQYANNKIAYTFDEGVLCFSEYELYLPTSSRSLSGLRLEKNGKKVYSYKKLANTGELPPLGRTPEVFAIADTPRIIIPEGGYSKDRKGQFKVTENVQDIYLLLCQKDAKKLRKLYVELTGRPELVRLATLGSWNSKYYAYTEQTAKQLILDFEAHNVPLDNMVIDTDWRSCENGWGYDINKQLFPDMKRFLDFAHAHNIDIMFNDHPEPVDKAHVFRANEIAYRERNLQSLMSKGLDTWWYDRNWSTSLISPSKNLRHETLGLYLFHDITKHFYQKKAGNKEVYRRPDVMGNAVNIFNGRYLSITDTASHRYGFPWTGDTNSDPSDLGQEICDIVKAGNNCIPYLNSDCGGHLGNPSKAGFIRWMQYGVLSPIFRPHCTKDIVARTREPWVYDDETLDIVREYNNLRYRLLPLIYQSAYNSYETGEPIFKSLGWNYPNDKRALACTDEYMLGNNILIKPIVGMDPIPLKKSHYTQSVKATYFNGRELQGDAIATAEYDVLDMTLNHESPEEGVPVYDFSARFTTKVKFDKDVELTIKCDDGATIWIDGEKVYEDKTLHSAFNFPVGFVKGGIEHDIIIEYFQAGGEAAITLLYNEAGTDDKLDIYLPQGKWIDVFGGNIYVGGKVVRKAYNLREMPLFVRLGAIIPLAYNASNTKVQKWDNLVLDYYPDKSASDYGYLYEDDTETTAYKLGEFAKTPYEAFYNADEKAYVVRLHCTNGHFNGEKCFDKRHIVLKTHMINGLQSVSKVTLNGREIGVDINNKIKDAFVLDTTNFAADSKVAIVSFDADADKEYEIKIYE